MGRREKFCSFQNVEVQWLFWQYLGTCLSHFELPSPPPVLLRVEPRVWDSPNPNRWFFSLVLPLKQSSVFSLLESCCVLRPFLGYPVFARLSSLVQELLFSKRPGVPMSGVPGLNGRETTGCSGSFICLSGFLLLSTLPKLKVGTMPPSSVGQWWV